MNAEGEFKLIKPEQIQENIIKLIGEDWMLVCAGNLQKYNMMTASWGFCGVLWNKPVAVTFIRPHRYTYEFIEKHNSFTLNFFDKSFRETLNFLGTKSGRDVNKMNVAGLEPRETANGSVYFRQSKLLLECKKLYTDDLKPSRFENTDTEKLYPKKDYHRFYIGEIVNAMQRI